MSRIKGNDERLSVSWHLFSGKMKTLIVFVAFFAYATCNPRPGNGVLKIENLTKTTESFASTKDVTLYFYTREDSEGQKLKPGNDDFPNQYDQKKQHFFIIHGWKNNYKSDINKLLKEALLDAEDVNIFVVDWSGPAHRDYPTSRHAITVVGDTLGNYINMLRSAKGLEDKNVVMIGHSLGAHIAGLAGAIINGTVNFIIGLDPALPLFELSRESERLDPSDAGHVQVLHTNGGEYGFLEAIGDSDFYPNGGISQPGCSIEVSCSHNRSFKYLAESIRTGGFTSVQCDNYEKFRHEKCSNNPSAAMGGLWIDKSASGKYYLDTNRKEPYSKS